MVAKDLYQCRQCVSKRTLADEKEVNTFIEDDTRENGIFGAAQMRGAGPFFEDSNRGAGTFFQV